MSCMFEILNKYKRIKTLYLKRYILFKGLNMAKVYETEDTVVYRNEDRDTWIKNKNTNERTYIPSGSEDSVGTFDSKRQIHKTKNNKKS